MSVQGGATVHRVCLETAEHYKITKQSNEACNTDAPSVKTEKTFSVIGRMRMMRLICDRRDREIQRDSQTERDRDKETEMVANSNLRKQL